MAAAGEFTRVVTTVSIEFSHIPGNVAGVLFVPPLAGQLELVNDIVFGLDVTAVTVNVPWHAAGA
jgi:hypothetical protein